MIKFELEEWQVMNLRNYFGENSKTQTAHWAYIVFDKALKEQCNIPDVVGRSEQLCGYTREVKLCINCKKAPANRGLGKHTLICSDCWNSMCD